MRVLALLLLLVSCKRPYVEPHDICVMSVVTNRYSEDTTQRMLVTAYEKFKLTGNTKQLQKEIFDIVGICTCKNFDFMTGESTGELIDYPLSACNTLTGTDYSFFVKNLKPYLKEIDRYFRKETK